MQIVTARGWLQSIAQTDQHELFGTAYAIVKGYDPKREREAREATTNLEIVVHRPNDVYQYLAFVIADNDGWVYPAGVPVKVCNIDPNIKGDQINGKAAPCSLGWRLNGDLEVSANLRVYNDGVQRQAWVRLLLRQGDDGKWGEVTAT